MATNDDYRRQIHIDAAPERVFSTLTNVAEFGSWWGPATGGATEGGEVRITFEGVEDTLVLRVRRAVRPSVVIWEVTATSVLPEWVGTAPAFTLAGSSAEGCDLEFRHEGLAAGGRHRWDQYLPSLRDYVQTGTGNPWSAALLG
jgi:hypothetical protein